MKDCQQNKRAEIIRLIKEAAGESAEASQGGIRLPLLAILLLVGTTFPFPAISSFCSIAAVSTIGALLATHRRGQGRTPRNLKIAVLAFIGISLVSGCSPMFDKLDTDILSACRENTGNSCKYGMSTGYSVFGVALRHATVDQARLDGQIDKVFGVETVRGAGLVSVTRLTVYGG